MVIKKQKKRRKIFFPVLILMAIAIVLGFGVGVFFFAPKITGKHVSVKVGVRGVRLLTAEELANGRNVGFSDVWEKGVNPKDIPALKDDRPKQDDDEEKPAVKKEEQPTATPDDTENTGAAENPAHSDLPAPAQRVEAAPESRANNDPNYTMNSRKRDE